ncbi:5-oxoprolinase subunit PxpA [Nitrincola sp. A-D6]|uniref:5-oxoprolinase subunit PxpA n=1 Tax=Nitrincola sp. A-D6 TaxID=1545442 RepID=UPI0006907706|nr:5-oxoprolinase subunit PxpA [Nitrincola sp. A-D6]
MLLNADVGESFGIWTLGRDAEVIPWLDQANIACGFHASDPLTMQKTVCLALAHQVSIGAHPAYPDLIGFGRRSLKVSGEELRALIRYQVGALQAITRAEGGQVDYVKPHGALYNDMMSDAALLQDVMEAIAALNQYSETPLSLMLLSRADNSAVEALAERHQLPLIFEAFADRAYTPSGLLMPRSEPGAVHHDSKLILAQAISLARQQNVSTPSGLLSLKADSLCVHGDNEDSIATVRAIHQALRQN